MVIIDSQGVVREQEAESAGVWSARGMMVCCVWRYEHLQVLHISLSGSVIHTHCLSVYV